MSINKRIVVIIFFYVLLATNGWGWWSVPINLSGSTHHRLTDDAQNLIGSDYPDVTNKFGGNISDWTSGTTDDARAHAGDILANGGPIDDWWDRALEKYQSFNFASGDWSAYYYIALMMHLTEDQAVTGTCL